MERATVLRAGASLLAAITFVGADGYVLAHPKNDNAPLRPPAADDVALRSAVAVTPSPRATGSARATPTPRGTAIPKITLQPGVRATDLPAIAYTHVS